ncbi:MAG: tetratricopeptide repeat protein [Promethearchaeota archaeon]|jgi:tetratricopeptide (TPR) repeat protein
MVIWKVHFALGAGQEEEIDLADVEDLVDWDPEFQGKLISSFFDTDYHWLLALKTVVREDITFPSKNFLLIVGRKWGEDKKKTVPLGVLFEFSEGDLKLRAVGPQSVAAQAGGDNNLLLDLVNELFDFPQRWRSKSVICGISKKEWRKIADIIGEEPWRLLDNGRRVLSTDPKKAISDFQKAYQIFTILADLNGQFHAMFAQLEVALEAKNYPLAQERLEIVRNFSAELGDQMLEENVFSTEGIILYEQNDFQSAVSVFENALEKAKKATNHKAVINAYNNIGECYYRLANYDNALKNFDIARGHAEERNDKDNLAISQVNIAKVLCQNLKMGDVSSDVQATHYLTEALEYFEKSKDPKNLMIGYGTFGNLEEIKENYDSAMIYYERAAEITQTLNDSILHDFYYQKVQSMRQKLY